MSERTNLRKILVYGALLLVSGALIVTSYFVTAESLLRHVISEIGIAGLIGFILAMTIERLSAAEFRNLAEEERAAIKTDVFHYVYGRKIPPEITHEIDKQILESNFMREKLFLHFELSTLKDPESNRIYVKSIVTTDYYVRNISNESQPFILQNSVDLSPTQGLADQVKFIDLKVTGCENPISLDEPQLRSKSAAGETQIVLKLDANAIVVSPEQPAHVKIQYQGIRHRTGGRMYFSLTNHVCDLDLTIHVPKQELQVFAEVYSPHSLVPTNRHKPLSGYYNWSLHTPLLANQAIAVMWKPQIPK